MNLANRITILRILLTPLFLGCLLYWKGAPAIGTAAAVIFTIACLTDALDGYVSRRLNQKTRLGSFIDPLADKMLLTAAYVGMTFFAGVPVDQRLPIWLTLAVLSRDVILICGAAMVYVLQGRFEPHTNLLGKATTFFQMLTVLSALWNMQRGVQLPLAVLTGAVTVLSCAVYLRIGAVMLPNGGTAEGARPQGPRGGH